MQHRVTRSALSAALLCGALGWSSSALAAGWDTPILHTARHQGMGGTAIAGVNDPSATFHNPAGLGNIDGLDLIGSFSLLTGGVKGSPNNQAKSVDSETLVAPIPFLAAGMTFADLVSVGLGAYPVASGAATYKYDYFGTPFEDRLSVLFLEITPQVAISIPEKLVPGHLTIGVGYRLTYTTFDRFQGEAEPEGFSLLEANTSGLNGAGIRVGIQYSPIPELRLGAVLRNTVTVETSAESGVALGAQASDVRLDFVLPLKAGFGARFDIDRFGLAVDYEYADQSQNEVAVLSAVIDGEEEGVPTTFNWQDGHTVRAGFEFRAPLKSLEMPLRVGYVYDAQVVTKAFPSAFGTPPAPTNSVTGGVGIHGKNWQINAAGAYRFGETTVTPEDLDPTCSLCGKDGDYAISLVGLYLDASYNFDF